MRITRMAVAFALGLFLAVQAGSAGAAQIRQYRGRTSAGKGMYLGISGRANDLRLHEYAFRFHMDCEDGSVQQWSLYAAVGGRGGLHLHRDRSFEQSFDEGTFAFSVTGTVGPHAAEGTFAASSALTDEPACSTGDLTWAAHERDIVSRLPATTLARTAHVRVARVHVAAGVVTSLRVRAV